MRTRKKTKISLTLLAAALASAALLSGCSTEAGPAVKPQAGDPGPQALQVKLDALSVDQCFTSPADQIPSGCEKYITQLANTSNTLRARIATSAGAEAGGTVSKEGLNKDALTTQANNLDKGISAFRAQNCTTISSANEPCAQALIDVSNAVKTIKAELSG